MKRTWGRPTNRDGTRGPWTQVTTDINGFNDEVYITTLAQNCLLNLGESPFFADYGIPARPSVVQQVFPDYYVTLMQKRFSGFFASLIIAKVSAPFPSYLINVTTMQGFKINASIPVPT